MNLINLDLMVSGKRYRTETATLIASDVYFDGSNMERHGRNTFLLRTPRGNFFLQYQTQWQGERDRIEPISKEEAKAFYEHLPEHDLDFAAAFEEEPEEA